MKCQCLNANAEHNSLDEYSTQVMINLEISSKLI
jgi:hypothetical protein